MNGWDGGPDLAERLTSALGEIERLTRECDQLRVENSNLRNGGELAAARSEIQRQHDALIAALSVERERDQLRARVEALADRRDVEYPQTFKFAASDNHVAGYRAAQADFRAILREGNDG